MIRTLYRLTPSNAPPDMTSEPSSRSVADAGRADEKGSRIALLKIFLAVLAISFILRILYSGHLYEDDGLWLTAAEEILRGKALYREIYFDKPPVIALVYALLFKLFGVHIIVIRLFTILYSAAISAFLYVFGSSLYGRRTGTVAALMFAIFSTTYATGHMQGLNTDFLMVLPYTAGAFFFARSRRESFRKGALFAVVGGALTGLAFQINSKAAFDLLFFGVLLAASVLSASQRLEDGRRRLRVSVAVALFALATLGFAAGWLPFLLYIVSTGSLGDYEALYWQWSLRYARYRPVTDWLTTGVVISSSYFSLNNTLLLGSGVAVVITIRRALRRLSGRKEEPQSPVWTAKTFGWDFALLLWLAVSYAGVVMGGRLYAHYFFQLLPALCLLGSRGLIASAVWLRSRGAALRQAAVVLVGVGFAFTMVRFHGRTVLLAVDRILRTNMTGGWSHQKLNREERMVAAVVRDLEEGEEAADKLALEAIRTGGPRTRPSEGPQDYLFVWGYRPEIYFWSGLLPASRYLSTQPLTGVPADAHYWPGETRPIIAGSLTEAARTELVRDLERIRPKYVVDELGFFNAELSIEDFPELREFIKDYKNIGATGRFFVYRRRDMKKARRGQ